MGSMCMFYETDRLHSESVPKMKCDEVIVPSACSGEVKYQLKIAEPMAVFEVCVAAETAIAMDMPTPTRVSATPRSATSAPTG